jgi:hypothetical protein
MAQPAMARITCSQCNASYNSERELHDHKKRAHREFGSEQGNSHTELLKSDRSFSKRRDTQAEAAITESVKLEKQEAPQKEIELQQKEANDLDAARQKNRITFRP